MPVNRLGGILCLEGDWDGELASRRSVLPMLELLERQQLIEFVHRDVGTRTELAYYLGQWGTKDASVADFHLLYLACHGGAARRGSDRKQVIQLSKAPDGALTLDELADILGGNLTGVVIHIGACSVLAETNDVLQKFVDKTGIAGLVGYTNDVDWIPSAAMDLLFFETIARFSDWRKARRALDANTAFQALRRDESLGFRIWPE